MKANVVEAAPGRCTQAGCGLDRQHVGSDHLGARGMPLRRQAQRQRKGAGAGVRDRAGVSIIEVQSMHQNAIHQHRVTQQQWRKGAHDGAIARAAQGLQAAVGAVREILL